MKIKSINIADETITLIKGGNEYVVQYNQKKISHIKTAAPLYTFVYEDILKNEKLLYDTILKYRKLCEMTDKKLKPIEKDNSVCSEDDSPPLTKKPKHKEYLAHSPHAEIGYRTGKLRERWSK